MNEAVGSVAYPGRETVLGVAVPYAIANVFLTVVGPIIVGLTLSLQNVRASEQLE